MKALKILAASTLICAAGSAFASYDDGQPDNDWLMKPAASQVQTPAPAPAPAPAASSDSNSTTAPRATSEDRDILLP
jgi:hypothetical protein